MKVTLEAKKKRREIDQTMSDLADTMGDIAKKQQVTYSMAGSWGSMTLSRAVMPDDAVGAAKELLAQGEVLRDFIADTFQFKVLSRPSLRSPSGGDDDHVQERM